MHTYQRIWQYFKQHRVASIVVGHVSVVAVLVLLLLGNTFGSQILGAFANAPCSSSDRTYIVHGGDTLSGIASRYNTFQAMVRHRLVARGRGPSWGGVTFSPMRSARGGQISVITSCTASMYRGQSIQMPGPGRIVLVTSIGLSPVIPRQGIL